MPSLSNFSGKIWKHLLPILIFIALLLICEGVFRALWKHHDSGKTVAGLVVPDKDLIWKLRPFPDGPIATNELGFRDTPYHPDSPRKILLLGDSVSWGDGIENTTDVYPQRLEQLLTNSSGIRHEIINSGVPGYSTFQELTYLRLYGIHLKPQMIILQFCLNDVVERYSTVAQFGGDNVFLGIDTRKSIKGIFGFMIRNSRIFEALTRFSIRIARNSQDYTVKQLANDHISDDIKKAWELTLSEINEIHSIANKNNIPLLLVISPYRFQLDEPEKLNQPQKLLLDFAHTNKITAIDLLPVFSSAHREHGLNLFNDENHFSITGHDLAAKVLVNAVLNAPIFSKTQ